MDDRTETMETPRQSKMELYRTLQKERDWQTALRIALDAGDEAIPWLAEWFYTGSHKVRSIANAALRQMNTAKVIPALVLEFKRNPDKQEDALQSLLAMAEVHADPQIPSTLIKDYRDYYKMPLPLVILERSVHLILQFGDRSYSKVVAQAIHDRMKQIASPVQFWGGSLGISGCLALCMPPAVILTAPVIYFRFKGWRKAIDQCVDWAEAAGKQLEEWNGVEGLGILAQWTSDPQFETIAVHTINRLLEQLNGENEIILSAEQTEALNRLFYYEDDDFCRKLVQKSPYWGDESTLTAVQQIAETPVQYISAVVHKEAINALPALQKRIERLRDVRTLMRPASEQSDVSTLMRSAPAHPDIPSEQLLRPAVKSEDGTEEKTD